MSIENVSQDRAWRGRDGAQPPPHGQDEAASYPLVATKFAGGSASAGNGAKPEDHLREKPPGVQKKDRRNKQDEAVQFLLEHVVGGDVPCKAIRAEAGKRGIAQRTLDRAKSRAGVRSRRVGFGPGATWYWGVISSSQE